MIGWAKNVIEGLIMKISDVVWNKIGSWYIDHPMDIRAIEQKDEL